MYYKSMQKELSCSLKLSIKDKNVNKTKTVRKWKALNKVLLNLVRKSTKNNAIENEPNTDSVDQKTWQGSETKTSEKKLKKWFLLF